MHIFCDMCQVKKLTFIDWIDHLLDEDHQHITRTSKWTKEMNDRSILVQDVNNSIGSEDVAWYFTSEGFLADFYTRKIKKKRIFVLQFDSRNTAEECIAKTHTLGDAQITVMWKEMAGLNLNTGEFDFQNRHNELNQNLAPLSMELQLQQFMKETTLAEKDVNDRHNLLRKLSSLIKDTYPNCNLYPFGSSLSGLGDIDSDIDVCVDAEDIFNSDMSYTPHLDEKMTVFNRVLKIMRRKSEDDQRPGSSRNDENILFSSVFPIRHARVPIIKIVHKRTGIKCDLSFENLLSVQNSRMIAFYISLDPRVRHLIHLVRYWGRYHDIVGCVQIKNYALTLMVLTFLQKKRIVPSVYFLQAQSGNKQILIDNWDASFLNDKETIMSAFNATRETIPAYAVVEDAVSVRSVFNLLYEFFDMYANLDFETQVICPFLGQFISKRKFENIQLLPQELKVYKDWFGKNFDNLDAKDLLRLDCPLCVTDPFNLSFNVGSCASEFIVYKFRKACKETSERLKGMLSDPDFESRQCITDLFFPVLTADFKRG